MTMCYCNAEWKLSSLQLQVAPPMLMQLSYAKGGFVQEAEALSTEDEDAIITDSLAVSSSSLPSIGSTSCNHLFLLLAASCAKSLVKLVKPVYLHQETIIVLQHLLLSWIIIKLYMMAPAEIRFLPSRMAFLRPASKWQKGLRLQLKKPQRLCKM